MPRPRRTAVGRLAAIILWLVGLNGASAAGARVKEGRPNLVLIVTDDQGHGDLGCQGNPKIRTPHLDRLSREGVRLERFYVSPVCAPTRASLLTGRYNYRTGVVDTFLGRALMATEEVTIAELLAASGYRTAIFGKWHLGDNAPLRPMDQGFQESLVIKGGGLGQPSDPPGGGGYFDPILQHNGRAEPSRGYCSDVFTDAAIQFISEARNRPFFVYLAFNAPHEPLQVPERDVAPYRRMNLAHDQFPAVGHPLPGRADQESIARVYGMVSNIDANLGRLFARLDSLGLASETIVIFLTDNGPARVRYNSGLRDRKGSVYEGGIRVPCFVRWPGKLEPGRAVDRIAAHIDLAPTVLDACGVPKPPGLHFDGLSLLPLLKGDAARWPDRTLYFQWHRGDAPELARNFAASSQRYKLVRPEPIPGRPAPPFELFDMAADPFERLDIAGQNPEVIARLRSGYEAWFLDVSQTRGYDPPRIALGSPRENPTTLTRQDWRGPRAGWAINDLGHWEVQVERAGRFDITLRFEARRKPVSAQLALRGVSLRKDLKAGASEWTFKAVALSAGPGRLEAWLAADKTTAGVSFVDVRRLD